MIAAASGNVLVENVIPKHLDSVTAKLRGCAKDHGDGRLSFR